MSKDRPSREAGHKTVSVNRIGFERAGVGFGGGASDGKRESVRIEYDEWFRHSSYESRGFGVPRIRSAAWLLLARLGFTVAYLVLPRVARLQEGTRYFPKWTPGNTRETFLERD